MTTTTEHSSFPSDETLAAYIEGRLDEATRKRIAEHMADCAECLEVLLVHGELSARGELDPSLEWSPRPIKWWRIATGGLAAAAAVALMLLVPPLRDRVFPRNDLRKMANVAPPQRIGDARLIGFPYRPRAGTMRGRGDSETSAEERLTFRIVAAPVQQRAEEHPNGRTLHAAGVAYLLLNERNDAVKKLEEALFDQTRQSDVALAIPKATDAPLLSDLAAAYIADGRYKDASNAAERAWQLSKTPEIAWNRAVAAEHVEPPAAAVAKWNQYLELEPKSDWTAEAQKHLADMKEEMSGGK